MKKEFLKSYKECIYTLQQITDYIYFKEIFPVSYFEVLKDVMNEIDEESGREVIKFRYHFFKIIF